MASQPVKRDMIHRLALLANENHDLPPNTPEDEAAFSYLLAYMENGGRLSRLAATLNVSRFLLDRWIKGEPERKEQFSRARALGADALVDEGGDLLDSATRETIAVANARAGWRKWLAGKYDPQSYGDSQAPQVQVNTLHYHAALARPPLRLEPPLVGSLEPVGERGYPTEVKKLPPVSTGEE